VSYKYSYSSWWWTWRGPKHVEVKNKTDEIYWEYCAPGCILLQDYMELQDQQNTKFKENHCLRLTSTDPNFQQLRQDNTYFGFNNRLINLFGKNNYNNLKIHECFFKSKVVLFHTHTQLRANEKNWRNVVWVFLKNTKTHRFVHLKS